MNITVLTAADAKRERVERVNDAEWRIVVREPAARNAANRRVISLIAERYGVHEADVRIVAGHRAAKKRLIISTLE